jgi:hypothetical protein
MMFGQENCHLKMKINAFHSIANKFSSGLTADVYACIAKSIATSLAKVGCKMIKSMPLTGFKVYKGRRIIYT